MSSRFVFDVDVEIQRLRTSSANPANPAKETKNISNVSNFSNGRSSTKSSEALVAFRKQAFASERIDALRTVLNAFHQGSWSLLERSAMSNGYTPHAHKLIERENVDKYRTLQDLAGMC